MVRFSVPVKGFYILIIALLVFATKTSPTLAVNFPSPIGFLNDFADVIPTETENELELSLKSLREETTVEVSVVTVSSLSGLTVDDFAVKLFEFWKIGKKGEDNGLLFLVSPNDRKVRIEVGYGLEPILPDAKTGRILDDFVLPSFKKNDYSGGIEAGVRELVTEIRKGYQKDSAQLGKDSFLGIVDSFGFPVLILIGLLIQYLASFLARSKSIWAGGLIGVVMGIVIALVSSSLILGFILPLVLGIIGVIVDYFLSSNYKWLSSVGKSTSFWKTGGGFGRGGGFGGGFGGFGGGRSGGGGSSRSW